MSGPYQHGNLEGIASAMDERYKNGETYKYELPWDISRHEELHKAVAELVVGPTEDMLTARMHDQCVRLLDVGCGMRPALMRPYLLPALKKAGADYVYALLTDISQEAINAVSESAMENDSKHMTMATSATPVENLSKSMMQGSVDVVVSVESIEHWSDVEAGLASIHHVLADDGVFVLTTPNRDSLHVKMGRLLGIDVPFCSSDHTYEFGHEELDDIMGKAGFVKAGQRGVGFAPYWALEGILGNIIRQFTDRDPEVVSLLNQVGRSCPEFSFCQAKAFKKKVAT